MGSSLTGSEDGRLNYPFPKLSSQGGDKTASTLAEDDMFSQVNHISYPMASREQMFHILNGLLN